MADSMHDSGEKLVQNFGRKPETSVHQRDTEVGGKMERDFKTPERERME